jgi:hypothetical protein
MGFADGGWNWKLPGQQRQAPTRPVIIKKGKK